MRNSYPFFITASYVTENLPSQKEQPFSYPKLATRSVISIAIPEIN